MHKNTQNNDNKHYAILKMTHIIMKIGIKQMILIIVKISIMAFGKMTLSILGFNVTLT